MFTGVSLIVSLPVFYRRLLLEGVLFSDHLVLLINTQTRASYCHSGTVTRVLYCHSGTVTRALFGSIEWVTEKKAFVVIEIVLFENIIIMLKCLVVGKFNAY